MTDSGISSTLRNDRRGLRGTGQFSAASRRSNRGQTDEMFSRRVSSGSLSPLLRSAEHGDISNDFTEISEAEADQIVARIRASWQKASTASQLVGATGTTPNVRPGR